MAWKMDSMKEKEKLKLCVCVEGGRNREEKGEVLYNMYAVDTLLYIPWGVKTGLKKTYQKA